MPASAEGQKYSFSKFNAQNHGLFYIKDIDADNQGVFVKLRIGRVLTERQVDTRHLCSLVNIR
jgi:hypothetical protein